MDCAIIIKCFVFFVSDLKVISRGIETVESLTVDYLVANISIIHLEHMFRWLLTIPWVPLKPKIIKSINNENVYFLCPVIVLAIL